MANKSDGSPQPSGVGGVTLEAIVRGQKISYNNTIYGKICNKKLGDFVGKKVRITVEEIIEED